MLKRFPDTSNDLADVVRRMAWMAEYNDPTLFSHLERIRGYVKILALASGLTMADTDMIALAAQLHDIGKIGLLDNLRTNRGNLNNAELDATNKHTAIGADLLKESSIQVFQMGTAICLTHHERWNGTGYPQGLRGEQIPLSGRIVGLADVFDALTTSRPYKKEVPLAEARALIVQASGQLFDPKLVTIFDEQYDEFHRIRQINI